MFRIYNSRALTRHQRFTKALVFAIPATILMAVLHAYLSRLLRLEFSIVFIGIGYAIGLIIQNAGRGVQLRFSILGAVLAFFCFVLSDLIFFYGFTILHLPSLWPFAIRSILVHWFSIGSIQGLLGMGFRAYGIYIAYRASRIV